MYKRQYSIWTWTSAVPSSLFHVPNGSAYYVAQDIREQERETVYNPFCKAMGAPIAPVNDTRLLLRVATVHLLQ